MEVLNAELVWFNQMRQNEKWKDIETLPYLQHHVGAKAGLELDSISLHHKREGPVPQALALCRYK